MLTINRPLIIGILLGVVLGIALGILTGMLAPGANQTAGSSDPEARKPLYWVAPMDDNYRRDGPGKSPMGMDLIPVYADDIAASEPGTVSISPQLVQNFGVRTAAVEQAPVTSKITTVGYVKYDEDSLVHIHPRVEGWVETLFVKAAGDPVSQGQALYSLYSPQLVNAQEELLLALRRDNQTLIAAARERLRSLQSTPEFIQQLEKSRRIQQKVTFYAPQSGVIDNLKIREGFYVQPGTTLMSIGKLDSVWVEAEVFERDSARVKKGLPVLMELDFLPGKSWSGVVNYVYPTLDPRSRTLRVRLKFDNPDTDLKPNMFAQVSILLESQEPVLRVPREAVIRSGKQDRVVVVMGPGQYKSVAVEIGRVGDENIEILSGLQQEDRVVSSAQFLIDSESSKSSDFRRMEVYSSSTDNSRSQTAIPYQSAAVKGIVRAVNTDQRSLTIHRDAIDKWSRPAATMEFFLADDMPVPDLAVGTAIHFEFEVRDELTLVNWTEITAASPEQQPGVQVDD